MAKLREKETKYFFCPFTVEKCMVNVCGGCYRIVFKFVLNAEYYDISEVK